MSYIYKITNLVNGKSYIGATKKSLSDRWKYHLHDSKRERSKNRPLYIAMNKYGIDNFNISVVEECEDYSVLFEREIYWIDYYDTFRNGYNATYGGSGKPLIDYGLVYETYKNLGNNCKKTAEILGIDEGWASLIIRSLSGKEKLDKPKIGGKRVNMYSLDGEYIRSFSSTREAARYIISINGLNPDNESGYCAHIVHVCNGKRKTMCGYKWRYAA